MHQQSDSPERDFFAPAEHLVSRSVSAAIIVMIVAVSVLAFISSRTRMHVVIEAPGTLEPQKVWRIRANLGGRVQSVNVATNDTVSEGALLFSLDTMPLVDEYRRTVTLLTEGEFEARYQRAIRPLDLRAVQEAEALASSALARARSELQFQLREHRHTENVDSALTDSAGPGHVTIDLAKAEVFAAQSHLRTARLQRSRILADSITRHRQSITRARLIDEVALWRSRINRTRHYAPTVGVVLTEQIHDLEGAVVATGDVVLEIGALNGWRANLFVPESDVHRVTVGQAVRLEIGATASNESAPLYGTVVQVASEPWREIGRALPGIQSGLPVYRVIVTIAAPEAPDSPTFRRGYSVKGTIELREGSAASVLFERFLGTGTR